jgi:hypothetical protein
VWFLQFNFQGPTNEHSRQEPNPARCAPRPRSYPPMQQTERVVPSDRAACCQASRGFTGQGPKRPNLFRNLERSRPRTRVVPNPLHSDTPCCGPVEAMTWRRQSFRRALWATPFGNHLAEGRSRQLRAPRRSVREAESARLAKETCLRNLPGCLPLIGQSSLDERRLGSGQAAIQETAVPATRCLFDSNVGGSV